MICENCHKENRGIAKFCKWCGKPLVSQDLLDKLVGLDEVKRQLKTIVDTYAYLRSRKDIVNVRISVNAVIIGETGTGKTALISPRTLPLRSIRLKSVHFPRDKVRSAPSKRWTS